VHNISFEAQSQGQISGDITALTQGVSIACYADAVSDKSKVYLSISNYHVHTMA